ncbi:MAG: helicase-associated domain-containing protein, partial [Isosphaeraceae bacterium]
GALWQRASAEPIRQTQTGALYKRDRERVAEDPVLAGGVSDALAPLPDLAAFWLALGQRVGVVERDETGQRITAASPSFWSDNAFHLPQMIATGWLALRGWLETSGAAAGDAPGPSASASASASASSSSSSFVSSFGPGDSALPYLRPAVLLWLATMEESEWVTLDDLAAHLAARCPDWDRERLADDAGTGGDVVTAGTATSSTSLSPSRRGSAARKRGRAEVEAPRGPGLLASILLGVAYPLGLVRAGEESGSGRRAVQLTPLGRYVLAAGPTPPPRPTFEQFLFVQPNFEVIAYRQGLTPLLVGRLSRFAWWSQIGAALELRLTRESIVLGLDSGLTADAMLEFLTRHGQRTLPAGVADAVRTWATRRERVTYYAAATLIEFASCADRDAALAAWPSPSGPASDDGRVDRDRDRDGGHEPPSAVGDRFLLVDDERTIPFDRFRMAGSRDYRRPPEVCMTVEPDGVTLVLDPARADLLIDAELARFADEQPAAGRGTGADSASTAADAIRRRFVVIAASLRRGLDRGLTLHDLDDWYVRRTGGEIPPAVRLLLTAMAPRVPRLKAARMRVLTLPGPALLDGLLQHPATSPWLGERLGPTAVVVPDEHVDSLRRALDELGLAIDLDGESVKKGATGSSSGG